MTIARLAVAVALCACSNSSKGDAGTGGTNGSSNPADVTSAADCDYRGAGGDYGWDCAPVTIALSEPVLLQGLAVQVATSAGDDFTMRCASDSCGKQWLHLQGDPMEAVVIQMHGPNISYEPTWVDVEMEQDGVIIGSAHFEPLEYACRYVDSLPHTAWCWEADPVTLRVTPANP